MVLWSDNQTTFAGTILAKGGAKSGDGGFVEVSSYNVNFSNSTGTVSIYYNPTGRRGRHQNIRTQRSLRLVSGLLSGRRACS